MAEYKPRVSGRVLNQRWKVNARHALYSEDGTWYHILTEFPAALFDANGYILFATKEEYENCEDITIGQHLHVPDGISRVPGYVKVIHESSQTPQLKEAKAIYEFVDQQGAKVPEEVEASLRLREGATKRIEVNAYERNLVARGKCIEHYGYICAVCNFDFRSFYGEIGSQFIHVHHIIPLSKIGAEYEVDPIKDLIPVCPNCHAMIHRQDPPFTIAELREMIA